ncbi:UNVERIFIED_CONTAM: hypothetical protein K2H54_064634 [Gekko kuhli]
MATLPVMEAPVTSAAPITTTPATTSLGTHVLYFPGTFPPGFYTPTGLTQQGVRALQPQILPNPFSMYPSMPLMAIGQLTQWGHFHPESTAETHLLTEEHWRDSRLDPQGQVMGQILQEQVIVEEDDKEEEEDPWATRLVNLERGQHNIQQNLEVVMLTIPEIVIHTLHAEREVERQGRELK